MAKRITDQQRIITFGLTADESALNAAIESLAAIRANRFPKKVASKSRKGGRKPLVTTDASEEPLS